MGYLDPTKLDALSPAQQAADTAGAVRVASLHPTTRIDAGEYLGWHTGIHAVHCLDQRRVRLPAPR